MGNTSETWTREPVEDSETSKGYPVTEQTTGINFRAYNGTFSRNYTSLRSYRSSLTYVTGSHAFKVGFTLQEGPADTDVYTNNDTALTCGIGQPFQVTVRTTPYTTHERLVADLGVYVQDTWTIKRMTVNAGLRWDYLNNKVGAQDAPGGTWIGPRHFDELTDVPNFKDLSPRLGVAYDLFGNGKTALKATLSRYVQTSTVGFARLLNPLNTSVNNTTRPWTRDAQRRRHPAGRRELGALDQQRLRPGEHRDAVRSRDRSRLRQAPQQLGSVGDSVARADVARRRRSCRTSGARRDTSRPPTTSTSRRPTSSRTASPRRRIRGCPTAAATRSAASTTSRRRSSASPPTTSSPSSTTRRQADRGVQRHRLRGQRAAPQRPVRDRRLRDRQHALQQLRCVRRQPEDRVRHLRRPPATLAADAGTGLIFDVLRLRHQLADAGQG